MKQNRNRLINTENKLEVAQGMGFGEWAKQIKGLKKYNLTVMK